MEAGKKSKQINDYKDKDLCQKWDKDGWLRWEAGQFLMNFLMWEIPTQFPNVGVFHFRPHFPFANFQKDAFFNILAIEFQNYPWVFFSFFKVFVWPT